jgi:2-succinyl-5-enolpyruvyl-6-hydroxy-3-cyclohexene-1-carboxylate synthase
MPVSKALSIFIKENRQARQIVVDGGSGWRDPLVSATEMVYCDESLLCESLAAQLNKTKTRSCDYLAGWQGVNHKTKNSLAGIRDVSELSEGKLFHLLADVLPNRAALFVGNSMPIRDLDTFFFYNQKQIRIMANRGANGIDGIISTALGAAAVMEEPLYLVLGDLTFFHDLNGLIAAKLYKLNITIILVNNNGGGIFSFLPQAEHPKHFERLFGTPLDLDFSHAVEMYGGSYTVVKNWDHFHQSFAELKNQHGLKVIEVSTDRDRNLAEHRNLWKYVSREIVKELKGPDNEA